VSEEVIKIAGDKTIKDWQVTKQILENEGTPEKWKQAFEDYFIERLRTRYLEPIRRIQRGDKKEGEGFAIVAIQCSLIEFFQSTWEGKNYKHKNPKAGLEYNNSSGMFKSFLIGQEPFNAVFTSTTLADSFYSNVRCSILHEARTSGGWRIRANSSKGKKSCFQWVKGDSKTNYYIQIKDEPRIIDPSSKILYRNDMTAALWQYITAYGDELCGEKHCDEKTSNLRKAFILKFNALATP
jgi:hypothetical protein